jgi:hypothetical protein
MGTRGDLGRRQRLGRFLQVPPSTHLNVEAHSRMPSLGRQKNSLTNCANLFNIHFFVICSHSCFRGSFHSLFINGECNIAVLTILKWNFQLYLNMFQLIHYQHHHLDRSIYFTTIHSLL